MSDPITLEQHLAEHALQERVWGWRCGCLFHSYGKSIAWDQVTKLHAKHVADTWREVTPEDGAA